MWQASRAGYAQRDSPTQIATELVSSAVSNASLPVTSVAQLAAGKLCPEGCLGRDVHSAE